MGDDKGQKTGILRLDIFMSVLVILVVLTCAMDTAFTSVLSWAIVLYKAVNILMDFAAIKVMSDGDEKSE